MRYYLSEETVQELAKQYQSGISYTKLQARFNIPYDVIKENLQRRKIKQQTTIVSYSQKIKSAEDQLISGSYPDYNFLFEINSLEDISKYKSLLNFYAKADLNSKKKEFSVF